MGRRLHLACVDSPVIKHASCKLWEQKVRFVGIWRIIKFRFMIFLRSRSLPSNSTLQAAAMAVVMKVSCAPFYVRLTRREKVGTFPPLPSLYEVIKWP